MGSFFFIAIYFLHILAKKDEFLKANAIYIVRLFMTTNKTEHRYLTPAERWE